VAMTAEFPDTSLADLEEQRALEAGRLRREFAGVDLADLEAERVRREEQLEQLRGERLPAQTRVVERRLDALRAEIKRRGHW
jgi:hypothetical protein